MLMKNLLPFSFPGLNRKLRITMLWVLLLAGMEHSLAQVSFTQTTDADFNLGAYNQLIVGGNSIYLQNAATNPNTWLTTTTLPLTLSGHKTATWHDYYVYLIGGYDNLNYSAAVYKSSIYGSGITGWNYQNSLPQGLKDAAVVIGNNTIYVLGGRNATQVFNTIYYASIAGDGSLGPWQTSAVTLPVPLWGHTATCHNGYIYVAGGTSLLSATTARNQVYAAMIKADNLVSSFSSVVSLPGARCKHTMSTYGNRIYIMGGYDNAGVKKSTVYSATSENDGSLSSWTAGSDLPEALSGHSAVVANGLILVMAGETTSGLSNTTYYATAGGTSLSWVTSPHTMYDNTKDGAAFSGNGIVIYSGGSDISGSPIFNCRYSSLSLSTDVVSSGMFISYPFFQLGAERMIDSLTFHSSYAPLYANCQVSYRSAPENGTWGNWSTLTSTSPIIVGEVKKYIQYKVSFTGSYTYNATFEDFTLTTPGTQLSGNLNGISAFTKALSPYWATDNIYFTGGTHTFEAGATILFLPQTFMYVGNANIVCNGNATDSVKFLYYTNETGKWRGLVFDDASDDGVSSQFYYTVIAQGGAPDYHSNLYCYNTNEPYLSHCNFRNADGHGISLNNSHISIHNCVMKSNTGAGLYLHNSSPHLVGCTLSYNAYAGVGLSSTSSTPTYNTTTIDHNLCGFRYPSPNFTFYQPSGSPLLVANTYNGLAVDGGDVNGSYKTWNAIGYDYYLLGSLNIVQYASAVRLTIEPGNTIRSLPGVQIMVGRGCCEGGELYAIGSADSLITFTSANGLDGGWNGIYFPDANDAWGGTSKLVYCKIEKGNSYNLACEHTSQPSMLHCTLSHSTGVGMSVYMSGTSPVNCTFSNNASDGFVANASSGSLTGNQFTGNGGYPIKYSDWTCNYYIHGNYYAGNSPDYIALSGGSYGESRYLYNDGIPYHVLGSIAMMAWGWHPRLTLQPGVTLAFNPGTGLQLGEYCCFGGEIWAEGKADSIITFKPYNNETGGWNGIRFTDYNDNWGGVSSMKYCSVEKGLNYNLSCENSGQPAIDHCSFLNSGGPGIVISGSGINLKHSVINYSASQGIIISTSTGEIMNNQLSFNGNYPVQFNDWTCNVHLKGNSYFLNAPNYISISGGDYSDNRTIWYDGIPYLVQNNIRMLGWAWHPRLTVMPGVTLEFAPGTQVQLGLQCCFGGDLWAEGTQDSLITFKPYDGLAGGWNGIYFNDGNDNWGGVSLMKYCVVEKGLNYNLYAESTYQPSIEHCKFTESTGPGLYLTTSSWLAIKNSTFCNNAQYGIYLQSGSSATIGNSFADACNFFSNGSYHLYNNTTNEINARYNYWGSGDSTMISKRIYDYFDLSGLGKVKFYPFVSAPHLVTDSMQMSGWLKYANLALSPLKNATMQLKNSSGTIIASTTSNGSGNYSFAKVPSESYNLVITPSDPWGGSNSTDALKILNHFAQVSLLSGMKLGAADVNFSHAVNATDALLVMKRYAGQISSFVAGDFMNHSDTVIENGQLVTNNILMLCMGDVNASFSPALKNSQSVGLIQEGSLTVGSFTEFDFPVRMKTGMMTGAISLGFIYPEQFLEITGVQLSNGVNNFSWTAENGLFRMAWADMNTLSIGDDEVFVILKMKSKDLSGMNSPIYLELYPDSEFADGAAIVNDNVVLSIPVINSPLTGLNGTFTQGEVSVHPNPFKTKTNVDFTLNRPGHVIIGLYNLTGSKISAILEGYEQPGAHHLTLDAADLRPGVYLLKIEFSDRDQSGLGMVKIVVTD